MIIEMESSYYVFFQIVPGSWHRYPCKLSQEGAEDFVQRMAEKEIPTRVEEVKNEMALFVA